MDSERKRKNKEERKKKTKTKVIPDSVTIPSHPARDLRSWPAWWSLMC
jgi:hypothetical protein